jgi:hypothetical protein
MRAWRLVIGLVLALPTAAEAAVLTGRVMEVDSEFNTMVLAHHDPLGNVEQWNLFWSDMSPVDPVMDSAAVGFELAVSAERTYFDTWDVRDVVRAPAAPEKVVVEVLQVNPDTGQVSVRDPVTVENHQIVLESYKLDGVRPGGHMAVDLRPRMP